MYSKLIGFACLAVIRKRLRQCEPKDIHQFILLAPGPKKMPIIGNLFDIPLVDMAKVFTEWKSLYGDIIYLQALQRRIMKSYSDRPVPIMLGELMGLGQSFSLLRYCAAWKQQRKLAHLALNAGAIKEYSKLQTEAVVLFLDSLIENPSDFISQLRLAAGRIVLSMTYGVKSPETMNFIAELEIMMATIGKGMMPGAYAVDIYIPSWVSFNNIHAIATEGRTHLLRVVGLPFEYAKQQVLSPSPTASFTATCLQVEGAADMEHHIRWAAGSMYGGELKSLTMELDRVVGHGQLPTLDDRSRLPYMNAVIKETMRWNPVVPLSLPHFTSKEDVYQGLRVPKGTIVFPNIWAMSRDDISGISPDEFAPERFLDDCLRISTCLTYKFRQGMMRFPESFHVCILPRSEQLAEELQGRAREMSKNGSE
ncbi:cytochrome P450 [Suillus discolor]|uniref:Cytochrome P450 n=1 Tax=Suillus discolor TaxID=1912936 RepID=A0A9P7F717_9AGAM|nr:cytochrome P450 [Suillus discolor]KAG2107390.1 cytochrome P450 [Suillus discolor]